VPRASGRGAAQGFTRFQRSTTSPTTPKATARGVSIESGQMGRTPRFAALPRRSSALLLNLLVNALRQTPSDGTVAVVVEPLEREVRLSVEDTGEGLPADASSRLFERLWRGDPARSRTTGGAGLGLAIARGLVEAQGGRTWAENVAARASRSLCHGPA
jgi:two-component system sensor histidine kinase BaeS